MKSFKAYLESSQSFGEKKIINRKPVFRSSAIFPVFADEDKNSRIHFMGYWLFKRQIKEVSVFYTIRNQFGEIAKRETILVDRVKAFLIDLKEALDIHDQPFLGSIELEVFSSRDMVFPYPAFVLEYQSPFGSSMVHTTGRVYNDIEDMKDNQVFTVAETGFDILPGQSKGYFSFVNGPMSAAEASVELEIINCEGFSKLTNHRFTDLKPYETKIVFFEDYDETFSKNEKMFGKIRHNFTGFFPRFIVGNMDDNENFVTLTHTFYDTSQNSGEEHYWQNPDQSSYYDSSIFVPYFCGENFKTELAIYPIFAPHEMTFDLTYFDESGGIQSQNPKMGSLSSKDGNTLYLNLDHPTENKRGGARLDVDGNGTVPARLKMGLNVYYKGNNAEIPCNICFATEPANTKVLGKPGTTKWAPIINRYRSIITINNSSFLKSYDTPAHLEVNFWRQQDDKTIMRKLELATYAQHVIDTQDDDELTEFLQGEPGWITIVSDNPMVTAWYFEISQDGIVGADHSF